MMGHGTMKCTWKVMGGTIKNVQKVCDDLVAKTIL